MKNNGSDDIFLKKCVDFKYIKLLLHILTRYFQLGNKVKNKKSHLSIETFVVVDELTLAIVVAYLDRLRKIDRISSKANATVSCLIIKAMNN